MTRFKSILAALSVSIFILSCDHHGRHMVITDNNNRTDITSRGDIQFTADSTAIKSISPEGYLSYEKNENRLRAERDKDGSVYLELYRNGKQVSLDSNSKVFLAAAVKDMAERHMGRITGE